MKIKVRQEKDEKERKDKDGMVWSIKKLKRKDDVKDDNRKEKKKKYGDLRGRKRRNRRS